MQMDESKCNKIEWGRMHTFFTVSLKIKKLLTGDLQSNQDRAKAYAHMSGRLSRSGYFFCSAFLDTAYYNRKKAMRKKKRK